MPVPEIKVNFRYLKGYPKAKTPFLYFEKRGRLCSGHGNLSVKVGVIIIRILVGYHNQTLKVNFKDSFERYHVLTYVMIITIMLAHDRNKR